MGPLSKKLSDEKEGGLELLWIDKSCLGAHPELWFEQSYETEMYLLYRWSRFFKV